MKKIVCILIIVLLICSALIGCSSKETSAPQKTEKELKAEMKAEEIEKELETELNENEKQSIQDEPEEIKELSNEELTSNGLIESIDKNYYKYKSNQTINFDIDEDGTDEEIIYDSNNGKLKIVGYDDIDIDMTSAETNYFIIIRFSDKYDTEMNMIGILDYGPSSDFVTTLYSIISPRGEKWFGSVGFVGGEIVPPSKYDEQNIDDFNYKAVIYEDRGIQAPVRLSILSQTWFGRNDFTYYSTYSSLIDNIDKYNLDYETKSELRVEKDVKIYNEKDLNSNSRIIKSGQRVNLIATDNKEWIKMVAEDGIMGWVNVNDITESHFSGYSIFD